MQLATAPYTNQHAAVHLLPLTSTSDIHQQLTNDWLAPLGTSLAQYARTDKDEVEPFHLPSGQRLYTLGLGEAPTFARVLHTARKFAHDYRKQLLPGLVLHCPPELSEELLEALVNGLQLGRYHPGRYQKQRPATPHPFASKEPRLYLTDATPQQQTAVHRALTIADCQERIMDLVNAPSNYKTPTQLAEWAEASATTYGYRVEVWDKETCAQRGLHALLAVNRGSESPARFIIMEYQPAQASQRVALVGKGITFDTGGLSIKAATNLHLMKSDMGGAAAVMGTIEAAARLQMPVHLIGIIPATDNSVDALSIKPGDVIDSYSGRTIEIIDTDAEGRLILADGLAYAVREYAPDVLLDLATLTGSSVRTLGYAAAALFTDNEEMATELYAAGIRSGEKVWRLPMWEDYDSFLTSDVADVRNLSGKPVAGAINAAKFLQVFTENHPRWAHLDIAGVALTASPYATDRSATAYGIRLLLTYLQQLVSAPTDN